MYRDLRPVSHNSYSPVLSHRDVDFARSRRNSLPFCGDFWPAAKIYRCGFGSRIRGFSLQRTGEIAPEDYTSPTFEFEASFDWFTSRRPAGRHGICHLALQMAPVPQAKADPWLYRPWI